MDTAFQVLVRLPFQQCCKSSQLIERTFCKSAVLELNTAITSAKETSDIRLTFKPIEVGSSHLRVNADASYATNHYMSSQIDYIITLCNDSNNRNILKFSSRISGRVLRSIMGAELCVTLLKTDLSGTSVNMTPVELVTGSKQFFDVIKRWKLPTKKRLGIDISTERIAYRGMDIERVGSTKGGNNPADSMSKTASWKSFWKETWIELLQDAGQGLDFQTFHQRWGSKSSAEPDRAWNRYRGRGRVEWMSRLALPPFTTLYDVSSTGSIYSQLCHTWFDTFRRSPS